MKGTCWEVERAVAKPQCSNSGTPFMLQSPGPQLMGGFSLKCRYIHSCRTLTQADWGTNIKQTPWFQELLWDWFLIACVDWLSEVVSWKVLSQMCDSVTKNPSAWVTQNSHFLSQTGKHFKTTFSKPSSSSLLLALYSIYVEWQLLSYAVNQTTLVF